MTVPPVNIREANPDDAVSLALLIDVLEPGDGEKRAAMYARLGGNPNYHSFVAEEDGTVVGFIDMWVVPDLVHQADVGHVVTMVVAKGRWGEGIGSALLEMCLDLAREKGLAELHVSTEKDNEKALCLYRNKGFVNESVLLEWDGDG